MTYAKKTRKPQIYAFFVSNVKARTWTGRNRCNIKVQQDSAF